MDSELELDLESPERTASFGTDAVAVVAPRRVPLGTIAPFATDAAPDELIASLEREIAAAPDAAPSSPYQQLGEAWETKPGRERDALDAWLSADSIDGNDLETLAALARLYRSTKSWEELSETLRRIIELGELRGTHREDESLDLFAQLAQLEGDVLGRANEAVRAWRNVVAIDASDLRALTALENLFVREGRWSEAVEVIEKRALVVEDDAARRDALLQAAMTYEARLDDRTRAAELYERVRAADAGNSIALERLEAIYEQQQRWAELVEILLERSELITDVASQITMLNSVARIYERELDDTESAFYVLQAAFKRDYNHEETARELERLATSTHRWQELLDDYTEHVGALERENRHAAADLWVKIGRWYGEHLSHAEYAIHSMQQALRIDPEHAGALGALGELQRRRGSWSDLSATLQREAAVAGSPEAKSELYFQVAELLEHQTQDLDGASRNYQLALEHAPHSETVLRALDRLYRQTEQWEPLIDVLQRRAAGAAGAGDATDARVERLLEIGEIADLRLSDAGRSIAAYQKVLDLDRSNTAALNELVRLYERTEQSDKYLQVLDAQLEATSSDAERVALYQRMAVAWERLGKLDRAAEALEQGLAIDPRDDGAYSELARIYRQAGTWQPLVESYRNHAAITTDVAKRVELYCAMGQVCETQLQDADRAVDAYSDALAQDADEERALDALGRLYVRIDEPGRALDILARHAKVTENATKRVELYTRMGRLQSGPLHDPDGAEANLLRALALDPNHVPAMEALTKQYAASADWLKAAEMMVRAEACTQVAVEKVRILLDAASLYHHRLNDPARAKQLYAAAIVLDPEHLAVGRALADLYFRDAQWAELRPVIEMVCRKAGQLDADPRELAELYCRAATCANELGEYPRALQSYKDAQAADAAYVPALIGAGDLLFKMKDWENAAKAFQSILARSRDAGAGPDLAQIYSRLGQVRQALGERKKALQMFEQALALDPTHRATLEAVVELQTAQNAWDAVVHAKRSLMETAPASEKAQLLEQIGAIYSDKLANLEKATATCLEALELTPNDHRLLQKLLDLHTRTKQWSRVIETIERFIALENDPFHKGVYCHAAATVCRDELVSVHESIEYYNRALDHFFASPDLLDEQRLARALRSFEAIDTILTTTRDWKGQERAYRAMIKRLPQGSARFQRLSAGLLDALGEIYRSRLKQYKEACEIFELAQQLDPKNELRAGADRAEILAELYVVAGVDHADKAIAQHTRMLRDEPFKYDSYTALARIYAETQQHDKRWCVSRTLAFLKKATPDEIQFYEQFKPRGIVKAKHAMSSESRATLSHSDENRYISSIFAACWQGVAAMNAFPHKDFGVKREDRRQLHADSLMFSRLFLYVAQILSVPLPEVYLIDDGKLADIQLANTIDKNELCPSFMVRPHLLQGKNEREVAFVTARRLELMRPEYYLRMLLPTHTELTVAALTAIVMVEPQFPVPASMVATVQQYRTNMQKRVAPHLLEQLGVIVRRFLPESPKLDLATWSYAVDAGAHRVGFVVCGDLDVSARMIAAEPVGVGGPRVKDKVADLVRFSCSEELFAVRAQMGLGIDGN